MNGFEILIVKSKLFNWEGVSSGTNIQKSKQDLTTGSPGG